MIFGYFSVIYLKNAGTPMALAHRWPGAQHERREVYRESQRQFVNAGQTGEDLLEALVTSLFMADINASGPCDED